MGFAGSLLGGIVDLATASAQKKLYKSLNPGRPTYDIPSADTQALQTAQNAANTTELPGQGFAQNNINQTTAAAANKLTTTGGTIGEIVGGLGAVNRNALTATNNLSEQGAILNNQNKQLYEQQANNYAQDQNQAFDYNQNQPYQTQYLMKQSARNAWLQNRSAGLTSLGDAADSASASALQVAKLAAV